MKINPVVLNSEIPAEVLNPKNLLDEIKIFEAEENSKEDYGFENPKPNPYICAD